MTVARAVLPGKLLHITQRTVAGQYLLQPTKKSIAEVCRYLFILACQRYQMKPSGACALGTHAHWLVYDTKGRHPEFTRFLHGNLARAINIERGGRTGNVWENRSPGVTEIPDGDGPEALHQACYIALNATAAYLVKDFTDWPGFVIDPRMAYQAGANKLCAKRPKNKLFKNEEIWPEEVEIEVARLPFHDDLDNAELCQAVRQELERQQAQHLTDAADRPTRFLGVDAIKRTPWKRLPKKRPPAGPGHIRPRVASSCKNKRLAVIKRNKQFAEDYYAALGALHLEGADGEAVTFPYGTWQMPRRAAVKVAKAPS